MSKQIKQVNVKVSSLPNKEKGNNKRKQAPSKGAKRPRKGPNKNINQKFRKESKAVEVYVNNLLNASKPLKMPRPIPVHSSAQNYDGEIVFASTGEHTKVQFRPDPFRLLTISEQSGVLTQNVTTPLDFNGAEEFSKAGEAVMVTGQSHIIPYSKPIPTTFGTFVSPIKLPAPANYYAPVNNSPDARFTYGFGNVTATGTYVIRYTNKANTSTSVAAGCVVINADGTVASSNFGAPATVASFESAQLPNPTYATPGAGQYLVLCVNVSPTNAGNKYTEANFEITSNVPITLSSTLVSRTYNLGEAVYPGNSAQAAILNDIYANCNLWAPIGMSCTVNVSQTLSEAGGRFQESFLPSYANNSIPVDSEAAWSAISGFGKSYPVKESKFQTGAHVSWVGQRIQDYEFRSPYVSTQLDTHLVDPLPIGTIIGQKASLTANSSYFVKFQVTFEIQTLHPAYIMTVSPNSIDFASLMLSMLVFNKELVGENPAHIKRLAKIAKDIATNPLVVQSAKAILPMLLAMI